MTQTLYRFTLPQFHNDGVTSYTDEVVKFIERATCLAGGATVTNGLNGHWHDDATSHIYIDKITTVDVAATDEQHDELLACAFELFADQKAIFIAKIGTATIHER